MNISKLNKRVFRNLAVDKIVLPDDDLRTNIDEEKLDALSGSVNQVGVLQPIIVSLSGKVKDQYRVIIGGRRLRAAKKSGDKTIPACIVDDISDRERLVLMLIENIHRTDLEPLEEADGMAELRDRFKYDEDRIAEELSRNVDFVRGRLALLKLPDPVKKELRAGNLGVSHGLALTRLQGKSAKQIELAAEAVEKKLPESVLTRMVEEVSQSKRHRKPMHRKHKLR
ncbi:MAG: ParB/RepB/Spo0J family partition protein, partial [Candidatus Peribacteraceae bacterium]|nr:ParB/RepB/Spo0J family partition protein [Candidatus Peribacteraceae bacterium]